MVKKMLNLTATMVLLAIVSLCLAPVFAWASQEGAYLYHQFFLSGPSVFYTANTAYTGSDNTARLGLAISSGTATDTGAAQIRFRGALNAKPASSNQGDIFWDIAQHTLVIATATDSGNGSWMKASLGNIGGTVGAWTIY